MFRKGSLKTFFSGVEYSAFAMHREPIERRLADIL